MRSTVQSFSHLSKPTHGHDGIFQVNLHVWAGVDSEKLIHNVSLSHKLPDYGSRKIWEKRSGVVSTVLAENLHWSVQLTLFVSADFNTENACFFNTKQVILTRRSTVLSRPLQ